MAQVNLNFDQRNLPPCPRCGSKLHYIKWAWLVRKLGAKPYWKCDYCQWKKTVEEVQRDGGLRDRPKPQGKPRQTIRTRPNRPRVNLPNPQRRNKGHKGKGNRQGQRRRVKQRNRRSKY